MPEVAGPAAIYAYPDDPRAIANALQMVAFAPGVRETLRERRLARVRHGQRGGRPIQHFKARRREAMVLGFSL